MRPDAPSTAGATTVAVLTPAAAACPRYTGACGSPAKSATTITRRRAGLYPSHVDCGESRARGLCLSVCVSNSQLYTLHAPLRGSRTARTLLGLAALSRPVSPLPSCFGHTICVSSLRCRFMSACSKTSNTHICHTCTSQQCAQNVHDAGASANVDPFSVGFLSSVASGRVQGSGSPRAAAGPRAIGTEGDRSSQSRDARAW